METKVQTKKVEFVPGLRTVDNLGRDFVKPDVSKRVKDPERRFKITYGVRPCKDDPTRTEVYIEKREDIHKMIQVNADKVGIKAMLKAVALGEISAASLADDGTGCVDDTLFSGYVPPVEELAKRSAAIINKAKEKYPGLDGSNFETIIKEAVKAEIQKQKAAAEKKEGE